MRFRRITAATMAISAIGAAGLTAISAPAQAATPSYLFTVEASSGSTAPGQPAKGQDERFTLTIRGVEPVTKFADRPFRSASVMSPAPSPARACSLTMRAAAPLMLLSRSFSRQCSHTFSLRITPTPGEQLLPRSREY